MPLVTLSAASSKDHVGPLLCQAIVPIAAEAIASRGAFSVALSGGSLPSFLSGLPETFAAAGVNPQWHAWHILLADERCVPLNNNDSNMKSLQDNLLSKLSDIPTSQIYAIDESKLSSTNDVASDYQEKVQSVLQNHSGGQLDLAVLGFGPDGHTCSLFPHHSLLQESTLWVAGIADSPKPPPQRITLTLPVLNQYTRHVVFCGAGSSKSPILQKVFTTVADPVDVVHGTHYTTLELASPPPYPCAMVLPDSSETDNTVTWIVDADALQHLKPSS